jgi:hypothetical protein
MVLHMRNINLISLMNYIMSIDVSRGLFVWGDFNLIREKHEKILATLNNIQLDWINKFGLMKIKNSSRQFSWANNPDNLIMALLDRIFVSTCWNNLFPSSSVTSKLIVGIDHTPLSCWLVGTKTFWPQRRLRIIPRWSKNIHKAHMIIFLPRFGAPFG